MMRQVGLRELRDRASKILREVREQKSEYVITHRGRPVALLIPVDQEALRVPPTLVRSCTLRG